MSYRRCTCTRRTSGASWRPGTPTSSSVTTETVFSLGNGFVGVRGSVEEGRPALVPGTFVNGFHETWPIMHAEGAHALARTGQTIVNVPDTTILKLYVDDEPFFLPTARIGTTSESSTCGPGR